MITKDTGLRHPETGDPGRNITDHGCSCVFSPLVDVQGSGGAALEGSLCGSCTESAGKVAFAVGRESLYLSDWTFSTSDVPVESLRLRFALLQSLNTTLETFFLPLVELRQTEMYANSIAALLQEAKGQFLGERACGLKGCTTHHTELLNIFCRTFECVYTCDRKENVEGRGKAR